MYKYEKERPYLFTDDGQRMLLQVRDNVQVLLAKAGSFMAEKALGGVCGDSWHMLACLDRLLELGEIREITTDPVAAQHRVFVRKR
jgi:hypothetical protein